MRSWHTEVPVHQRIRHRLYVYSWVNKEIQVWDYKRNLLLDHLTTPYDRGAVSIQPGRDQNTAYLANGFVVTQVDLSAHTVRKSIALEETDKHQLLSATYLIDETNDRVFVFSGDETNSRTLQTVYGNGGTMVDRPMVIRPALSWVQQPRDWIQTTRSCILQTRSCTRQTPFWRREHENHCHC